MSSSANKTAFRISGKRRAHDEEYCRKSAKEPILAVILWDEAGSIRRTGSGNFTQQSVGLEEAKRKFGWVRMDFADFAGQKLFY